MKIKTKSSYFIIILQLAAFSVFIGRAWQHLYWDAPFRAILWDEALLSNFVNRFTSMNWETYITSMQVDQNIGLLIKAFGVLYLISATIAIFINRLPRFLHHLLIVGAIGLIGLAMLYCKESFFSIGQFFEYTLQFGSPLFLWWSVKLPQNYFINNTFLLILKIAIALTFTCHGLYAVGYYPIPVQYMDMTMNILGVKEASALTFLKIVGLLDFVMSIGIFLPYKWAKFFLLYSILWGFSTTIARIWANFNWEWLDYVLLQWLHESIMRMPHFLIPLAVFIACRYNNGVYSK